MSEKKDTPAEANVLDVVDYRGERVVFSKKKWKEKSVKHPELLDKGFMRNLKRAVEMPQIVWQDYSDPVQRACYYWRHKICRYVKVVVWVRENPCQVVTAFEINHIKEEKYPNLKRLK